MKSRRLPVVDVLIALAVGALVFVVHDVPYLLRQPYWFDETWVADSLRLPLSKLRTATSSSPFLWTLLLRLSPVRSQQGARIVPLIFAGLTVSVAYWFARELRFTRVGAVAISSVVLFVPAMSVRDQLKQYTAEAFLAVLIATLLVRAERSRDRRRLVTLAAVVGLGVLLASADIFFGYAALGALLVTACWRRDWHRARDVALATGVALVMTAALIGYFTLHDSNPALTGYWHAYYLPANPWHALHVAIPRAGGLVRHRAGLSSIWIALPALGVGLAVLSATGEGVLAWMTVGSTAALVVVSVAHRYPFLDERTATWLVVLTLLFTTAGIGRLLTALPRSGRRSRVVGHLLLIAMVAVYAVSLRTYVRSRGIPIEDTRTQARLVAAGMRPGDVVVVSEGAQYGFAYYSPALPVHIVRVHDVSNGFDAVEPDPPYVVMRTRDPAALATAISAAQAMTTGHPDAHIWLVRDHMSPQEKQDWLTDVRCRVIVQENPKGLIELAATPQIAPGSESAAAAGMCAFAT